MPKFLCVQRSLAKPTEQTDGPPDMQAMYAKFTEWSTKHKDALIDMGGRLGGGRLVTDDAQGDGPFVEVKELVGGYMIVEAADLEAAVEVARACPGVVRPGSGIEVIEILTK